MARSLSSSFLALLPLAAAFSSAGQGFGAKPAPPPAKGPPGPDTQAEFLKWADDSGIKQLVPLQIDEFDGERGVGAAEPVDAGAAVLSVPSNLALQVNTLSPAPRWCDEDAWNQRALGEAVRSL